MEGVVRSKGSWEGEGGMEGVVWVECGDSRWRFACMKLNTFVLNPSPFPPLLLGFTVQ